MGFRVFVMRKKSLIRRLFLRVGVRQSLIMRFCWLRPLRVWSDGIVPNFWKFIIRIKNTFHIDAFMATESLLEDIGKNEALAVIGKPMDTAFNADHDLEFDYQASDRNESTTTRK